MEGRRKFTNVRDNPDLLKTLATLSQVYQYALHDNYFQAKDLLLTLRLKKTIRNYDSDSQILYNRTVAHLGLCAFRITNIQEAHNCLTELMDKAQWKELLAPDLLLGQDIRTEKRRLMPYLPICMDINLELLECVYLVSAMLIEIPYIATHECDADRRKISKTLYQQLRSSERQVFFGPPNSTREHVVAAAKAMRNGDWAVCNEFIVNEKMNRKVWNLFSRADVVRAMLTRLIKEESLRVYLFTFSHIYDSLSISMLGEMFELEKSIVHSIITKMIIEERLMASFDVFSQIVVVHHKPSHLQTLAVQLTDKLDNLVDSNVQIFKTIHRNKNVRTFRSRRQRK